MHIEALINEFCEVVAPHFSRPESRRRASEYLAALLADVPRKNGRTPAAHLQHGSSGGLHWLLNSAVWDADRVLDVARSCLRRHFGHPDGVLVADEVRFVKKGDKSAGVASHVDQRTGRSENCQLAVFLAYTSSRGRALVDRELFLPHEWVSDLARLRAAAVPDAVTFRTKADLVMGMTERAHDAGLPFNWLVGFAGCEGDEELVEYCTARRLGFMVQVDPGHLVDVGGQQTRSAAALAEHIPPHAYERRRYGLPSTSPQLEWAALGLPPDGRGTSRTLLVRRAALEHGTTAFYLCWSGSRPTLGRLIGLAEAEWTVSECIDDARRCAGLGDYEVRKYLAWYRHMAMALAASMLLAAERSVHSEAFGIPGVAGAPEPASVLAFDHCPPATACPPTRKGGTSAELTADRFLFDRRKVANEVPADARGPIASSGDQRYRQVRLSMPRRRP